MARDRRRRAPVRVDNGVGPREPPAVRGGDLSLRNRRRRSDGATPADRRDHRPRRVTSGRVNTSLGRIVGGYEDGGDFAADDLETTIDRFLTVDDSFVFFGDVDTDEITARLTEPENSYATEFERVDERGVFDVYGPVDAESESAQAFAVGDDVIVLSTTDDDPVAAVGRLLDARIDGVGRATDDFSDLGWLLETAGEGEVVFADYSRPDADRSSDGVLIGFLAGLTYEGETGASGDLGMAFTRLPAERESALEDLYGDTADDVSFEFGDDRVAASATWADVDAVLEGGD